MACLTAWIDNIIDLDKDEWEEMWEAPFMRLVLAKDQLTDCKFFA